MIIDDKLNQLLKERLQSNCELIISNKKIKEGRFFLFTFNCFYINFFLQTKKNKKTIVKIPYPFEYKSNKNEVIFSYKLEDFYNNKEFIDEVKSFKQIKSRFFDSILYIKFYDK